jgi:hypothetical protein
MIPGSICKQDVEWAAEQIQREGVPPGRGSRKFAVEVDHRLYPPKYVLSLAAQRATGKLLMPDQFSGGQEANAFLKRLGFGICPYAVPSGSHGIPSPE